MIPRRDPSWPLPPSPDDPAYRDLLKEIEGSEIKVGTSLFQQACINDFWFFCRHCLTLGEVPCEDVYLPKYYGKPWLDHPWLFARCREIQASPNGHLDLWPRFHFKTALLTQSLLLWEFLTDPDLRHAIITYKLDTTGESFLGQIKRECEQNEKLKGNFPETFYRDPQRESPTWTSSALAFRRTRNPKEPSVMVFGLMNNMPTSMHFDRRTWDDIVIDKNSKTQEMIETTNEAWRNASGLAADFTLDRMNGTRWATNDTYSYVLKLGAFKLRHHDVYDDDGKPVLRSVEWLEGDGKDLIGQRKQMGPVAFAAQIRNNPRIASEQGFDPSWLHYYDLEKAEDIAARSNIYIFVDTARVNKKHSDFTTMAVIALGRGVPFGNYYLLDLIRDRLSLIRTTSILFDLVEQYRPLWVFYEQFGAARDTEHIKYVMAERGTSFRIREIHEQMPKEERIVRLQGLFEAGRFFLPPKLFRESQGKKIDIIQEFRQAEYLNWTPIGGSEHDDMLDVLAWVKSPAAAKVLKFPDGAKPLRAVGSDGGSVWEKSSGAPARPGRTAWSW